MSIIGGRVVYTDGKKTEDYGTPRSTTVELSFDGEADLDRAAALAQAKVLELISKKLDAPKITVTALPTPAPRVVTEAEANKIIADAKPAETRGRKPLSDEEKAARAAARKADNAADVAATVTEADAAVVTADDARPAADVAAAVGTIIEKVVEDDLLGDVSDAVPVINDNDLAAAVQAHNKKVSNGPGIRKLIATYNPDSSKAFTLIEIPQAKRKEFLDRLATVPALA